MILKSHLIEFVEQSCYFSIHNDSIINIYWTVGSDNIVVIPEWMWILEIALILLNGPLATLRPGSRRPIPGLHGSL